MKKLRAVRAWALFGIGTNGFELIEVSRHWRYGWQEVLVKPIQTKKEKKRP